MQNVNGQIVTCWWHGDNAEKWECMDLHHDQ